MLAAPSVAPPGLRVNETGSRNMTILWDSVPLIHRNGEIVQYKLSYAPVNEELIEAIVNAADGMLFRAIDLIPGTLYSIKVAAFTSQGGSTFSDDINPRTLEESEWTIITIVTTVHNYVQQPYSFVTYYLSWQRLCNRFTVHTH